jgi:hypothetical protein
MGCTPIGFFWLLTYSSWGKNDDETLDFRVTNVKTKSSAA